MDVGSVYGSSVLLEYWKERFIFSKYPFYDRTVLCMNSSLAGNHNRTIDVAFTYCIQLGKTANGLFYGTIVVDLQSAFERLITIYWLVKN